MDIGKLVQLTESLDRSRREFQIIQDQYMLACDRLDKKECDTLRVKAHDTLDLLMDNSYLAMEGVVEMKGKALSELYKGRRHG